MNEVKVQRNYKDTFFRMLFKDKENLLSLYNALNNTAYTDVNELEITTLENAVYMNYKNDVSFVFELELMVTMYNINHGCNKEIMDACRILKEYAMYVEQVRIYAKQMPLAEAVEKTVDHCIKVGILSEFLRKNRAEAIAVSIYEYDEEAHMKSERELWYKTGVEEGRVQTENRLNKLYSMLIDSDRLDDLKRATRDKTYQEQLITELLPEEMQKI